MSIVLNYALVKANYSQYKKSSDQVVLELGTNGDFTVKQLDDLLNQFGKAKIYLVNTRVPRIYEANVNRLLLTRRAQSPMSHYFIGISDHKDIVNILHQTVYI